MKNNRKFNWVLLGFFVVTLVGCKTLQETAMSKKVTKPAGVTLLSEQEMRDTLVGNTYAGDSVRYPGSTYIEFIRPDGKIKGLWNGTDRYTGEWAISGNVICAKYPSTSNCSTMSKSGDTIYWYDLDGTTEGGYSKVTSGDSQNLGQ